MFEMDHSEVVLKYKHIFLNLEIHLNFRHSLSFIIKGKQQGKEAGKPESPMAEKPQKEMFDLHGSVFNLYLDSLNIGEKSDNNHNNAKEKVSII